MVIVGIACTTAAVLYGGQSALAICALVVTIADILTAVGKMLAGESIQAIVGKGCGNTIGIGF